MYFLEYVLTKDKKMQCLELDLPYKILKHIESDRSNTLERMYKKVAQNGNVLSKEREREKTGAGEKRKEIKSQPASSRSKFNQCDCLYKDVPPENWKVVFPSDLYVLDMESLDVI